MRQKLLPCVAILSLTFVAASDAMCQWVQTNGPYGGTVSCLAQMGTNIFAGGYNAGVFRSTDSGKGWKVTGSHFSDESAITAIGSNIIAASDDGVFYSTDSGSSWNASAGIFSGGGFTEVTGMVAVGRCLFAATLSEGSWCKTYLSRDSGKNWIDTLQPPDNIESLVVINGKIFAGGDGGGYLSTDTGLTWTANSSGLAYSYASGFAVSGKNLFAITSGDTGKSNHVFFSTDNGFNWTLTDTNLPRIAYRAIAASGEKVYVGTDSGVYVTTNNGANWSSLGLTNTAYIYSLEIIGSNILVGTQVGLYLTYNSGMTWNLVGVPCTNIYSMALQGSNLVAGTSYTGHIYISTNNGNSWTVTSYDSENNGNGIQALFSYDGIIFESAFDGVQCSKDTGKTWADPGNRWTNGLGNTPFTVIARDGQEIIAGSWEDEIFRSSDNGATWVLCDKGFTNNDLNSDVRALAREGNIIIAGTSNEGILISTDNGATWDVPNNGFADTVVLALAVSGNNVLAATYPDGVYLSTNGGNNWESVNNGLENTYVYSFAVSNGKVFAGTNKGVFLSTNNGTSWSSVNSGLPANFIHDLVIKDSSLFVGTDSLGVWRRPLSDMASPDYMLSANADTISFGSIPVGKDSLQIVTLTNNGKAPLTIRSFQLMQPQKVFATSDLSSNVVLRPGEHFTFEAYFQPTEVGVYRANLSAVSEAGMVNLVFIGSTIGSDEVGQQSQSDSKLIVHPNPFSQSSTITFSCAESGAGEVTIVNLLGAEVARLFSGELGAGEHSFEWDAIGAAPGVYECVVRVGGNVQHIPLAHLSEP